MKVVFDHYIQHLDSLGVREVHEQEIMYLLMCLDYMRYVKEFDHVPIFPPIRIQKEKLNKR